MGRSLGSHLQAARSEQHAPASRRRVARTRPALNLVSEADNEAAKRWRENMPCTERVVLGADLVLQDNAYERYAHEHGAFIAPLDEDKISANVELGIWGSKEQAAAAKKAIVRWSTAERKGGHGQKFHKLASLLPQEHRQKVKEYKAKVRQHRFRQVPGVGMMFEAIGSFHWPVKEYRPEEVFGRSFEALDPIRMSCSCYICFLPARSIFQIYGRTTDVQEALNRLRMTYFQIVARMAATDYTRTYALYWPTPSKIPSHIKLADYTPSQAIASAGAMEAPRPELYPRAYWPHDDTEGTDRTLELHNAALVVTNIGKGIVQTLSKLHYYRGHIEVRLHLGKFIVDQYEKSKDNVYTFDQYKSMIQDTQFVGSVTDEIGDRDLEGKVLRVLKNSDELLKPADSMIKQLTEILPTYSATFIFPNPSGDLRLEVAWQKIEDMSGIAQYEVGETKWARLDRDSGIANKLHDIFLTDLKTSSAWEFQIVSTDIVDTSKVPSLLREFTSKLRLTPITSNHTGNHTKHGDPIVELPHFPKPRFYRQQTNYEYRFQNSGYHIKLTRFQDHTLLQSRSADQRSSIMVHEPRWSLNVSLAEWNVKLSENARLPIGGRAEWSDDENAWFPDTGEESESPFSQLVHGLKALTKCIFDDDEETGGAEDSLATYQGMPIG